MQKIQVTEKTALKLAVRAYDDYQRMRLAMGNRIKIKKDGSDQVIPEAQQEGWAMTERDKDVFGAVYQNALNQEKVIEKHIKQQLKSFSIWTEYLSGVKGIGSMAAARIISEYDIEKATTVSKLWQFTGLNPGLVRGQKIVDLKKAMAENYKIVKTFKSKKGEKKAVILTENMIRGDKLTEGFLAPFNKNLRTKIVGVVADGFIKSQNAYCMNYYYPYKERLAHEESTIEGADKAWKDVSLGHRDRAAKRYMMKMFLKDLYVAWRSLSGLPVREPYQEQYLGHVHKSEPLETMAFV